MATTINLRAYREERGIKGTDVAEAVQAAGFVKCDKQAVSKVENIAYGLTFTPRAWRGLFARHGNPSEAVRAPRTENRARPNKLCLRFTDDEYKQVLLAIRQSGKTAQNWGHEIIMGAMKGDAEHGSIT